MSQILKKNLRKQVEFDFECGERGIRTPGAVTPNSFQDYRNRPLCHLSAAKLIYYLIYKHFLQKKN